MREIGRERERGRKDRERERGRREKVEETERKKGIKFGVHDLFSGISSFGGLILFKNGQISFQISNPFSLSDHDGEKF